jgi:ABC-type multidrug transport system ATPase subunit
MRTPEQGADTLIYLASSPEVEGMTGKYVADRKMKVASDAAYDEPPPQAVGGEREAHGPRGDGVVGRDRGIVVEGLVREFRKGPRAVDGIDLRVEPGEVYGFLGPNGAGKSTTVLMLTTLLPPTGGTARVAGYDIVKEGPQVRASIGAALQEAALDPFLTGREHLNLQAALHGIPRAERKKRGSALLERVGLQEAADRRVRGYSGGMKRRLDLALALVHRPRILFLDEPTTGLDPRAARRCGRR